MASDSVKVLVEDGADLARGINGSDAFGDEVKAAAILRQGQSPSIASAAVGIGLWNVLKPRANRDLPKVFVLALTDSEALAFDARGVTIDETDYYVTVKAGPLARWPRSTLSVERTKKGVNANVALHVGGETILCSSMAEETLDALEAELATRAAAS
jgi:hypothetical protein